MREGRGGMGCWSCWVLLVNHESLDDMVVVGLQREGRKGVKVKEVLDRR